MSACLQDAECILGTTPDEEFKTLKPEDYLARKESFTIVDFLRCMPDAIHAHLKIKSVSVGPCIGNTASIEKFCGLLAGAID